MDRRLWILSKCSKEDLILDIGCQKKWIWEGTNFNVVGLDLDVYKVKDFVCGDAHELPFKDKAFDVSVLAELLEHVPNPIRVLKEAKRVTRKKVIVTVPAETFWHPSYKPFQSLEDRMKELGVKTVKEYVAFYTKESVRPHFDFPHIAHRRHYTGAMLEYHLLLAGFEKKKVKIDNLSYSGWSFWVCEAYC